MNTKKEYLLEKYKIKNNDDLKRIIELLREKQHMLFLEQSKKLELEKIKQQKKFDEKFNKLKQYQYDIQTEYNNRFMQQYNQYLKGIELENRKIIFSKNKDLLSTLENL